MDKTKKKGVVTNNQDKLSNKVVLSLPTVRALVIATACVKGKNKLARSSAVPGRTLIEKNVPLRTNIGVVKRSVG
jgi:hypothetical protein